MLAFQAAPKMEISQFFKQEYTGFLPVLIDLVRANLAQPIKVFVLLYSNNGMLHHSLATLEGE